MAIFPACVSKTLGVMQTFCPPVGPQDANDYVATFVLCFRDPEMARVVDHFPHQWAREKGGLK